MELFKGLSYTLRGFAILRRNKGLALYWVPPIVITFAALVTSFVLAVAYHDDLVGLVWSAPAGEGVSGTLLSALYWIVRALAFLLSASFLVVVCVVLSTLLAAPFNDALSEAVEERETGREPLPFSLVRLVRDVVRTVRLELLKLVIYATVMGPLLVLSWVVPGAGQVAYVGFGALFTATYFAVDYVDWPASRRGMGIRERLRLFKARPLLMLGFGFGVWACLFVPLLNLAFMPLAVAGGTRLFLDLESEGRATS